MLASFSDSQEWTNQFPSYCLHLHSHPYVQATGEPSELERASSGSQAGPGGSPSSASLGPPEDATGSVFVQGGNRRHPGSTGVRVQSPVPHRRPTQCRSECSGSASRASLENCVSPPPHDFLDFIYAEFSSNPTPMP